jgi:hypothetical protein
MCLGNGRYGNLTIEAQLVERGPWKKKKCPTMLDHKIKIVLLNSNFKSLSLASWFLTSGVPIESKNEWKLLIPLAKFN